MNFQKQAEAQAKREALKEIYHTSFLQKDCHARVLRLIKILTEEKESVPQANFRKIVQRVLVSAETGELPVEIREAISNDPTTLAVFNAVFDVISSGIRGKVKDVDFAKDLTRIEFPDPYKADLISVYTQKFDALTKAATEHRSKLPSVESVNWRVDVTISTTSLSRVFKPSVTIQMTTTDGKIRTFECSTDKFHELRFAVAKTLKAIQDLQQHPTLHHQSGFSQSMGRNRWGLHLSVAGLGKLADNSRSNPSTTTRRRFYTHRRCCLWERDLGRGGEYSFAGLRLWLRYLFGKGTISLIPFCMEGNIIAPS